MKFEDLPMKLNRFTHWRELSDLVKTKMLLLRGTTNWEDKNDVEVIKEYEKQKGKKVFVKCFCATNETIHHWRSYAKGPKGCCIQFDTLKLMKYINDFDDDILPSLVHYRYISDIKTKQPPLKLYPFTKRKPYRIEHEYRIICLGTLKETVKKIPIQFDCIKKITFSPEISDNMFITKRKLLRKLFKRSPKVLPINKSTVIRNENWISLFKSSDT